MKRAGRVGNLWRTLGGGGGGSVKGLSSSRGCASGFSKSCGKL